MIDWLPSFNFQPIKPKPWQASMMECEACGWKWCGVHLVVTKTLECPICRHRNEAPVHRE